MRLLDDKHIIKFDLWEDQMMTFVCAIYEISAFFSRAFLLDEENLMQL